LVREALRPRRSMILLHCALVRRRLCVWGESDQEAPPREVAAAVAEAVPGLTPGLAPPERLVAWLPTAERRPLPSSPLLEPAPPTGRRAATPRLMPWDVS